MNLLTWLCVCVYVCVPQWGESSVSGETLSVRSFSCWGFTCKHTDRQEVSFICSTLYLFAPTTADSLLMSAAFKQIQRSSCICNLFILTLPLEWNSSVGARPLRFCRDLTVVLCRPNREETPHPQEVSVNGPVWARPGAELQQWRCRGLVSRGTPPPPHPGIPSLQLWCFYWITWTWTLPTNTNNQALEHV